MSLNEASPVSHLTAKTIWSKAGNTAEHHDVWDLDSASPPVLFQTKSGLAVGEANKGGFWHEVLASTGKPLTTPVSFVYQHRVTPKPGGPAVVTWPGYFGGSEWSPVPYDPQTGLAHVSGLNVPIKVKVAKKVSTYKVGFDVGGSVETVGAWTKKYPLAGTGTLTAIDVDTGKISWQKKEPVAMVGGATTTAGGLLFVGVSGKGVFQALDAKTGQVRWQHALGGPGWGGFEKPTPATFTAFALP